ncbi:hypothetical protein VOLCADRAFT_88897 [Volvox carteri f. nagariensis]|uniref:Agmatine deiminase n=1 Tax=Volvox carteri f. nagariensis TaxID=3068 RepID=D8TQ88_VOLCA|nr:uncharacterized protein VOLCADRAFT_88897 [Volvox carteri f. nagariensis]EFJ50363.1 hypothetical protein VOLCADRAFT_88897 [Volvox carteri f. nagariensis]|eukprot:XP_002948488.1 hypothetical protein VOLCADRAFT_88897 [Volvox carteri f. nagariensis]
MLVVTSAARSGIATSMCGGVIRHSTRTISHNHSVHKASGTAGNPTPRELGFRMPGEYEPHAGTWMAFPYDPYLWRDEARPAQQQQVEIARAISQFEPVWMLADPKARMMDILTVYDVARSYFRGISGVEVINMPTNDVWTRDWGPTCVVRDDPVTGEREVAAVHFDFNCYGSPIKMEHGLPPLLPDWSKDRAAGRSLSRQGAAATGAPMRVFECPLHLEGGAVQSDGAGTLLVTEECLLHYSRDPELDSAGIEALLRDYLGAERVVWLWKGMVGDEQGTNGHVDNVAAFAAPGIVLLAWSDDADDPRLREVCARNLAALDRHTDAQGRPLRVIKVPCPHPPLAVRPNEVNALAAEGLAAGYATCMPAGRRLPASYINYYVANGGVVVPQFGGEQVAPIVYCTSHIRAAVMSFILGDARPMAATVLIHQQTLCTRLI